MINDGILVINKPGQWTSHDCVAICRRVLRLKGVKKIGHGGTLDPMAEGVLPIFIGQATRIMEYLELDQKEYRCEFQLGVTYDTQDIWGRELSRGSFDHITEEDILKALERFRGPIEQTPPLYSAVRIDGKHLYEYARKGRTEEDGPSEGILERVKPRRVYIHEIEAESIDLCRGRVRFRLSCSKGTYVRTICSELGRMLGCGAAMTALTRTRVGEIGLGGAISPEQIKAMDQDPEAADRLEDLLLRADDPLVHFGKITMPSDRARYFRQGNSIRLQQINRISSPDIPADPLTGTIPCNARGRRYDRIYRVYQEDNELFLGTGYEDREQDVLKADKVFMALNEPKQK